MVIYVIVVTFLMILLMNKFTNVIPFLLSIHPLLVYYAS